MGVKVDEMKAEGKERITTMQATIILVSYTLATNMLTLPRTAVEAGGTPDVWISVIVGGFLSMLAGIVIVRLSQRFPGQTFYQYNWRIVGKPLGIFLGMVVVVYFLCIASYEVRIVQEVTSFFLLEGTPVWAITGAFMWVALYLCIGGINAISQMCKLIFPIIWTIFLGSCLLSLKIFDINNLRPVLGEGIEPIWKALKPTALTFTAGETLLFLTAFMNKPKKATRVIVVGTFISMFFYVLAVVMAIGVLSVDGVVTRTWPFFDVIRSFEVKYFFFERFEALLLSVWIVQIFCSFCITLYGAALGISQIFNKGFKQCLFVLLPVIYIISETPRSMNSFFAFGTGLGNWTIGIFGLVPLPLLIIANFRRAGS